jgi:hypothetical protein
MSCRPNYDPCLDGKLNQIGSYAAAARSSAQNSAASAEQSEDFSQASAFSAGQSATSASQSATSATNSANSATDSANSASEANNYLTQVTNIFEDFDERYLGAKSVAPTVDNQGNSLQEGALYWNSVSDTMYVWDGVSWITATGFNETTPFLATGTTTQRNLAVRMADVVNVKDFGAVGDGVAFNDIAFAAAISAAGAGGIVYIPKGQWKFASQINIDNGVILRGEGWDLVSFSADTPNQISGTVLICDYSPMTVASFVKLERGAQIENCCLYWVGQTTPSGTWTPITTPWAITTGNFSDTQRNVRDERSGGKNIMLLGWTHGIKCNTGSEQGIWERIFGQPLTIGFEADGIYDVIRLIDFHFWPFWNSQSSALNYMRNNATALRCGRVDGLMVDRFFCYAYDLGVEFYPSQATGFIGSSSTNFSINSIYSDSCNCAFRIGGTYAPGNRVTGSITRLVAQHASSSNITFRREAIQIEGGSPIIDIINANLDGAAFTRQGSHVLISATNAEVSAGTIVHTLWDNTNAGNPAINVTAANTLFTIRDYRPLSDQRNPYVGTKTLIQGDTSNNERNIVTMSAYSVDLIDSATGVSITMNATPQTIKQKEGSIPTAHGCTQFKVIGRIAAHTPSATFAVSASGIAGNNVTHTFTSSGGGVENLDSGWKTLSTANGPLTFTELGAITINGTGAGGFLDFQSLQILFR